MPHSSQQALIQAPRTHPAVIADGTIHQNPHYIEPTRFPARIE